VTIAAALIPDLRRALEEAERIARERGILPTASAAAP
jgi:hypothetical protein